MQSVACTHARQHFLPPSSPSSFPKLNQMGFSISLSLSPMLPPCCQLCLSCCGLCVSRTTGCKGFDELMGTTTELPPARVGGRKTLWTQRHGRVPLPCWAAWIPGAHQSSGRGMNYFFCLEETHYLLKAKQPGSFGEEHLQGPNPLQNDSCIRRGLWETLLQSETLVSTPTSLGISRCQPWTGTTLLGQGHVAFLWPQSVGFGLSLLPCI